MANVIPTELRNARGLNKLKDFYTEQLRLIGDENSSSLRQLRADIQSIELELVGKPLVVCAARK